MRCLHSGVFWVSFSSSSALIIMDDVISVVCEISNTWETGPTLAWREATTGKIELLNRLIAAVAWLGVVMFDVQIGSLLDYRLVCDRCGRQQCLSRKAICISLCWLLC